MNFDLKKFLVENKLTINSRILQESPEEELQEWTYEDEDEESEEVISKLSDEPVHSGNRMKRRDMGSRVKSKDMELTIKHLNEGDSLEDMKLRAEEESKNGYAVHVNKLPNGSFELSDWYDADKTVASYENGRSLNEGELGEAAKEIATTYQLTPRQIKVLKDYGSKESTNGRELYISQEVFKQLQDRSSAFKLDFATSFPLEDNYLASQILTALKKSISRDNTVTIKDKPYFVLKGNLTATNFYFDNPYRVKYKKEAEKQTSPEVPPTEEPPTEDLKERKKHKKLKIFGTHTNI